MNRDADPPALSLALVEKAKARGEECEDGRNPVSLKAEGGGGPWLVVVLEEAGQVVLEVEARREMLADRACVAPGCASASRVG